MAYKLLGMAIIEQKTSEKKPITHQVPNLFLQMKASGFRNAVSGMLNSTSYVALGMWRVFAHLICFLSSDVRNH